MGRGFFPSPGAGRESRFATLDNGHRYSGRFEWHSVLIQRTYQTKTPLSHLTFRVEVALLGHSPIGQWLERSSAFDFDAPAFRGRLLCWFRRPIAPPTPDAHD